MQELLTLALAFVGRVLLSARVGELRVVRIVEVDAQRFASASEPLDVQVVLGVLTVVTLRLLVRLLHVAICFSDRIERVHHFRLLMLHVRLVFVQLQQMADPRVGFGLRRVV